MTILYTEYRVYILLDPIPCGGLESLTLPLVPPTLYRILFDNRYWVFSASPNSVCVREAHDTLMVHLRGPLVSLVNP